jgi:hypothetical protein
MHTAAARAIGAVWLPGLVCFRSQKGMDLSRLRLIAVFKLKQP